MEEKRRVKAYLNNIRNQEPRIHCISNLVSANLCANGLLACGGKPIMAEALEEVEEITAQCEGLNLNLGVPSAQKVAAMILAGKKAYAKGIPVVFDPVGVGASHFRMESAARLLLAFPMTMVRGNVTEIQALVTGTRSESGVDAQVKKHGNVDDLDERVSLAVQCAQLMGTIVVMSGELDIITDGRTTYMVSNGDKELSKVTGTGCLGSVLATAFLAVNPEHPLMAAVVSCCMMGVCGERAMNEQIGKGNVGNGSYAVHLLDAISSISGEELESEANYELYERNA